MEKIYSQEGKLLHIIIRKEDIGEQRQDVIPADNFLQIGVFILNKSQTFKAHKHIWKKGEDVVIAQEAWICIEGSFKAFYYDEDGKFINQNILNQGDVSATVFGGHNYEGIAAKSLIIEVKTGPYSGQVNDKEFI